MTVTLDLQLAVADDVPSQQQFEQWAQAALAAVDEDCELSIRLVDADESMTLNQTYRGKDAPTNVLSFPFDAPIPLSPRLLGDLVLCVPVVAQEAAAQGKLLEHHWAHLVVHGCLHLLGYNHLEDNEAEQMEILEITILQTLNIGNPYLEQRMTS